MKFYIAASWPRMTEAAAIGQELQRQGHVITSRWHGRNNSGYAGNTAEESQRYAHEDLADVNSAEVMIQLTGDTATKGGRHSELGVAIATGKPILLLGPREQIFHYCKGVEAFESPQALGDAIHRMKVEAPTILASELTITGKYKNRKTGMVYIVDNIVKHSETLETMVVYTPYPVHPSNEVWARPWPIFRKKFTLEK